MGKGRPAGQGQGKGHGGGQRYRPPHPRPASHRDGLPSGSHLRLAHFPGEPEWEIGAGEHPKNSSNDRHPGDTCREHYEFRGGIFVADGVEKTRELETEQEEGEAVEPEEHHGPDGPSGLADLGVHPNGIPPARVQTGRHHGQNPRDSEWFRDEVGGERGHE